MIKNPDEYNCPLEITIQLIGGKYKSIILWHLINKTLRYNELRRLIPMVRSFYPPLFLNKYFTVDF